MTATLLDSDTTARLDTIPSSLASIAEKVVAGVRLSKEEGKALLDSHEGEAVRQLADYSRKKKVGDIVYFATTQYIHPTNLCELSCPMCSYYAEPGWETAWFMTPEQVEQKVRDNYAKGVTEIHVVGGLWRDCNLDYYKDIFTRIKAIDSNLHIKALTPVEYDFLATLHGTTVEQVFDRMMSWGLGSLPGGGAEILVESIRKQVAPQKISSDRYMEIHKIAHEMGLRSNITMLFGHVEDHEHIIEHLDWVRRLQDQTGGFQTFVPLKYYDENNALGKRKKRLKPKDIFRVYAVSRLMLDNINNIKTLWNYVGVEEALKILSHGANDFGSTAIDEKIIKLAGRPDMKMTHETMTILIEELGRTPKQIHSGYDYQQDLLSRRYA